MVEALVLAHEAVLHRLPRLLVLPRQDKEEKVQEVERTAAKFNRLQPHQ